MHAIEHELWAMTHVYACHLSTQTYIPRHRHGIGIAMGSLDIAMGSLGIAMGSLDIAMVSLGQHAGFSITSGSAID